jgi:hypothetical protein
VSEVRRARSRASRRRQACRIERGSRWNADRCHRHAQRHPELMRRREAKCRRHDADDRDWRVGRGRSGRSVDRRQVQSRVVAELTVRWLSCWRRLVTRSDSYRN